LIGVQFGTTKETVDRYEIRTVSEALYYVKGKIRDSRPVAEATLRDQKSYFCSPRKPKGQAAVQVIAPQATVKEF